MRTYYSCSRHFLPVIFAFGATAVVAQPSLYTMKAEPAHVKDSDPFGKGGARKVTPAAAEQYMIDFSRCVLLRYPQYVPVFLVEVPGTSAARKRAEKLGTAECVENGTLTMNDQLLRGGLYEAMYKAPSSHRLSMFAAPLPLVNYRPADPVADDGALSSYMALIGFADCVARAAPLAVDKALLSATGSPGETAAFSELGSAFGDCAARGAQVKFSKIVLRGLLAEAAYRIANAPTEAAAARK